VSDGQQEIYVEIDMEKVREENRGAYGNMFQI
jgi:hypothetical protein